jgi:hypothetical protein
MAIAAGGCQTRGVRIGALSLVPLLAAALLGGCSGGGGDETTVASMTPTPSTLEDAGATTEAATTTEPTVTHAEFIAALDAICKKDNKDLERYDKRYQKAVARSDYDGAADAFEDSLAGYDSFYEELEALDVPPEDAKAIDRYLAFTRQIEALVVRIARGFRERDDAELSRLGDLLGRVQNKRTLLTARLGLTECGGG